MPFRVGVGYDVHKFSDTAGANHVAVCGVKIAHSHSVIAHSDGDVGIHALVDAIFGSIGEGGIGVHFPCNDIKWRDADSSHFLIVAREKLAQKGYFIVNLDITVVCELPKITPYVPTMRERLATILDIDVARINVKAVTTEKLGFLGRGEGIAAHAVVLCGKMDPS